MATAKPIASTTVPRRRTRKLVLLAAAIGVALLAWFRGPLGSYAVTGASYGARMGCACRFVEGRALSECRKDFEPGMSLVQLDDDPQTRSVSAGFPLLPRQTATFHEGEGCVLEKWGS